MGTSWTPCPCKFHDSPSRGNSRRHRAVATWNVDGLSAALHLQDAAGARGKQSPFLSRCFSFARSHHRSRQIFAKSQAWTLIYGKAERGLRFAQFYGHAQQYADDAPGGGIHPHPAQPQKMGLRSAHVPHHTTIHSCHGTRGTAKPWGAGAPLSGWMPMNSSPPVPTPHGKSKPGDTKVEQKAYWHGCSARACDSHHRTSMHTPSHFPYDTQQAPRRLDNVTSISFSSQKHLGCWVLV